MRLIERMGHQIALVDRSFLILSVQQALEILVYAMHVHRCSAMVIFSESLPGDFFNLRTCFAGEMLQKFSTYGMRLAIVGSFDGYDSDALQAFIRECNRARLVFWKTNLEDALEVLCEDQWPAH